MPSNDGSTDRRTPASDPLAASPFSMPVKDRSGIRVTAHYFAVFREQAGTTTESLTTGATTAAELFAEVSERHGLRDSIAHCKVAINDELASWDRNLSEGDVVLFFPPVAGG